ncbi:uncharacterized protein LOC128235149 [Mya arenaria]|uniref:uncharacterized protein LOC128235149 n=1 Tax=Mya arenaria TaxID=6604 RepID=UPI0022E49758|nr:uncharacterized protein LOC128235149 [Mya arenaria]
MRCRTHGAGLVLLLVLQTCRAGILYSGPPGQPNMDSYNDDDWEPVYRIYEGQDWDSHDDYTSQERSARDGDKDDSQFRSWKLDQWHHEKIHKVRVELYDDGQEVAEFEFEGTGQNLTGFFGQQTLRRSTYDDIPDGLSGRPFPGDDFSFDGDDDSRHWTVSSSHRGDCRNDDGWIQVVDKPRPGKDRCVCGYENVRKYPTIMYAKGNRKARWSDPTRVGHADMMQVSISHKPYAPRPVPQPQMPAPAPQPAYPPQQYPPQQYPPQSQPTHYRPQFAFETKK